MADNPITSTPRDEAAIRSKPRWLPVFFASLLVIVAVPAFTLAMVLSYLAVRLAQSDAPGEGIGPGFAFAGYIGGALASASFAILCGGGAWLLVRQQGRVTPLGKAVALASPRRPARSALLAAAKVLAIVLLVRFSAFGFLALFEVVLAERVWNDGVIVGALQLATVAAPVVAGWWVFRRERQKCAVQTPA